MISRNSFFLTCSRNLPSLTTCYSTTSVPQNDVNISNEKEEEFRELFIMPKRKLQAQLALERLTGRAKPFDNIKPDIHDRLMVRRPRSEIMKTDQDWPSVWPAAATFNSSVVPLPVRMGYRRHVNKRPPFKTIGNLELMKIPNFLHLTQNHIKRHCQAIKKFCTEFPDELKSSPELIEKYLPLTVKYSDYIHQGTSIRDPLSRINTITFKLSALQLDEHATDKIRRIFRNKYDKSTDTVNFITDRCMTRKQNRDYADYLITVAYYESQKIEPWESKKDVEDDIKYYYDRCEISKSVEKIFEMRKEKIDLDNLKQFSQAWESYRNVPETPETVRDYEKSVRKLLGIQKVANIDNN